MRGNELAAIRENAMRRTKNARSLFAMVARWMALCARHPDRIGNANAKVNTISAML
jgi:hypothetical protein